MVHMPTVQTELLSPRSSLLCYRRLIPIIINVKGLVNMYLPYEKGLNTAFNILVAAEDSFLAQKKF